MAKTDEKPKIIIVRRGRKNHSEHHGGSWKVAYADFVTAMMAFFLLMWLINMSSQEKRAVLAYYFKNFSLFEKGGKSFMQDGGMKPVGANSGGADIVESGEVSGGGESPRQEIAPKLMAWAQQNASILNGQVFMGVTEDGIRIQIVDTADNPIFAPGSVQLTDGAQKIIKSVSSVLKNFPNDLAIEGHTDGSPTRNEQMSNWDLSMGRAASARKELELDGIDPERTARVVGFADKSPLFKENPADPRNRRISILFMKGKKLLPPENLDWLVKPPA